MPPAQPGPLHEHDLALRDRVLAGLPGAAEELFDRHQRSLYEFVSYRVGHDRATAEDIVQDTLMVALERLGEYRGEGSLSSWLQGIARNRVRGHRRRRRPVPMEDLLAEADPEICAVLAEIESTPLPEEILAARETRDLVGATLSSLSAEHRRVLLGKYVDGATVPELASADGRGVKATESSLHRARQAFARVFQLLARKQGGLP